MQVIAIDTETKRFGPGLVTPPIMCTSWAERAGGRIYTKLVSNGDGPVMKNMWKQWLEGDAMLVFLNNAYDLGVVVKTFPDLEPLVWAKLERGEVDDVKLREKLINLSTHGNLKFAPMPDGSKHKLGYSMFDLVLSYIGDDLSADKNEDSVRTQYELYDGVPSAKYPTEAIVYAKKDAYYTLAIYEHQEPRIKSKHARASCSTSFFRAAVDFALRQITDNGMRTDSEEFARVQAEMEKILHEDNLLTIIEAGILRPANLIVPHFKKIGKALKLLADWGVELPTSKWAGVTVPDIKGKKGEEDTWELIETEVMAPGTKDWSGLDRDTIISLVDAGIKFKKPEKMSINTKMLAWTVKQLCKDTDTSIKRTDKGGICCDSEVIQELSSYSEELDNYKYYQAQQKIVSTELPGMQWENEKTGEPELADRLHFCYDALVSTGRTSSFASKFYPSRNGQQIDPRVRPCYLPEEGMWLLSVDYSSLELCSVGQTTYELFGNSKHREKINAGYDLHSYLGAGLARRLSSKFPGSPDPDENYKMFKRLPGGDEADRKFYKSWRKFAKPVGLGYPGGLGAKTFIGLAKKTYSVDIIQTALAMTESELEVNSTVLWHAERIGIAKDEFKWTPFLKGVALAKMLKDVWLETYPEMVEYFEWVQMQADGFNSDGEGGHKLCYTTPLGMHRAGGTYTTTANGNAMQSPSAEGFCTAVYRLLKATRQGDSILRRCVLHNEVHDEVLESVPGNAPEAWEAICATQDIMEPAMAEIMPDVRISTEAALMTAWRKEAEPVYHPQSGLIVPWEPDVAYDNVDGVLYLPELVSV